MMVQLTMQRDRSAPPAEKPAWFFVDRIAGFYDDSGKNGYGKHVDHCVIILASGERIGVAHNSDQVMARLG